MNPAYLSTPVSALMKGLYEEDTTVATLKKRGDFGLGAFNGLDGEMVLLDGQCYQLCTDGSSRGVDDSARLPFACVTFFSPTTREEMENECDDVAFRAFVEQILPSKNMLYALRVEGLFRSLRVWSVHAQKNGQPIAEVKPKVSMFKDIEGTLAGFYTPPFLSALSMPGLHLHFISADRKRGGHLFQCQLIQARIAVQFVPELTLNLPLTLDYLTSDI
jgi:acetolactate decarboxylase